MEDNYYNPTDMNEQDSSEQEYDSYGSDTSYGKDAKDPLLLIHYAQSINIAQYLSDDELNECARKVISGMEDDETTMQKWRKDVKDAQELAKTASEPKNTPFQDASNIKFPLIKEACYQFAARTYPEFIKDGQVVKCEVVGKSPPQELLDKAQRISMHMSWQLLGEDTEWERHLDKLLNELPMIGFILKKTYYDGVRKKNVSIMCSPEDITIRNDKDIKCIEDLRRITHRIWVSANDLVEGQREGIYLEDAVEEVLKMTKMDDLDPPIELYEQHRFLDLDSDGYEEPYIVTVHKESNKVLRIVARYTPAKEGTGSIELDRNKVKRINPIQSFTDFHFLPALDGTYMSVGYGTILLHINETVNGLGNRILDAGKLANTQTMIMDSRVKLPSGMQYVEPGTIIKAQGVPEEALEKAIVPLIYKEPSQSLFQMMEVFMQTGKELASSTAVLEGTQNAQNVPATTIMALVEQGMKVPNSILIRIWRSCKSEFEKLFDLNRRFLDPQSEVKVVGDAFNITQSDYNDSNLRVIPVANPALSSDAQRMSKIQFLLQLMNTPLGQQTLNPQAIMMNMLQSIQMPNPETLLIPPQQAQKPDPKMVSNMIKAQKDAHETAIKNRKQDLEEAKFMADLSIKEGQEQEMRAKALKLLAEAASTMDQGKLAHLHLQLEAVNHQLQAAHNMRTDATKQNIATHQMMLQKQQQDQEHQREIMSIQQQQEGGNENSEGSSNSVAGASSNEETGGEASGQQS